MDYAPSTREILVNMVRRKLRQHRYDPNLDNTLSRLPVMCDLDQHPVSIAIREIEKEFDSNDRAVVMEAFWSNDCRLVGMDKACKTFRATLKKVVGAGLCWRTIVRILVIVTVLGDQYFKECQVDRIITLIELTLRYFSENHIEAWISAGENGWNDIIDCVFEVVEEPSFDEEISTTESTSVTSSESTQEHQNIPQNFPVPCYEPKRQAPLKPVRKIPVADIDPDTENLTTARNLAKLQTFKKKEVKKNPDYFKNVPRLDKNGEISSPGESGESSSLPSKPEVEKSKVRLQEAKSGAVPDRQASGLPLHGSKNNDMNASRSAIMADKAHSRTPLQSPSHDRRIVVQPPSEIAAGEQSKPASHISPSKSQQESPRSSAKAASNSPLVTGSHTNNGGSDNNGVESEEDITLPIDDDLSGVVNEISQSPNTKNATPLASSTAHVSTENSPQIVKIAEPRKNSINETPSRSKTNGRQTANQGTFTTTSEHAKRNGKTKITGITVEHSRK